MTTTSLHQPISSTEAGTRYVEQLVRDRIASGEYAAGQRLPSLRELADELDIERSVIRTAIQTLEREGLILRPPNCRATIRGIDDASDGRGRRLEGDRKLSQFVALLMGRGEVRDEVESGQQRIFWGVNQTLQKSGYHTVFVDLEDAGLFENSAMGGDAAYLQYALDQGFGGVVYYCSMLNVDRKVLRAVNRQAPLVLMDRKLPGIDADYVGVTNYRGTYEAVQYLIGLGHTRIAYVTRVEPITTVHERVWGYRDAMSECLSGVYAEMTIPVKGPDEAWPIFEAVLRMPPDGRPTAFVCLNDVTAERVAKRMADAGLRVPDDISIVGFDNVVTTLFGGVGLTTIAQPLEQIGAEAGRLLLRRLKERNAPTEEFECPTQLIVRESCRAI